MRHDLHFQSIPNVVRRGAQRWGDATALVDGDRRWSHREVEDGMLAAVRAAIALGVRPGDRVGLCAPNCAEWILAALGIQGAGGIIVPLNTRFKAGELAYILRTADARALFAASSFLGNDYVAGLKDLAAQDGEADIPALRRTVSLSSAQGSADFDWDAFLRLGADVPVEQAHAAIDRLTPDTPADLMFTSGTTGHPKGVVLTHGQSLRAYGWMAQEYTLNDTDSFLIVPPFFHSFGYKAGWLICLMFGVTAIPVAVFNAAEALAAIDRERVSVIMGPPTIFWDLINHPDRDRHDLTSLRVSMTGGTTIPEVLIRQMKSVLSFEIVMSAYGLTETSALVTSTRLGDSEETVARTTGRVVPDVEVRLVDDDGRDVAVGEAGEILVRGYNVTSGYWDDPEATAAAIDPDGWLHTGDVGQFDEGGNLAIVDRKKEMYIVGGFNAYPAEIEKLLLGCPGVAQAAVIGVPDERMGEVGCAFVVRRPDHENLTADQVIAWARQNMANFKVPRHVRFVDALPRNASQKVLKHELRALIPPEHT